LFPGGRLYWTSVPIRRAILAAVLLFLAGPATHAECLLVCWMTPPVESASSCHMTRPDGPIVDGAEECRQPAAGIAPFLKTSSGAHDVATLHDRLEYFDAVSVRSAALPLPTTIRPSLVHAAVALRI
jgi:hypothetical protein